MTFCQLWLSAPEGKVVKLQVCMCEAVRIILHQYERGERVFPNLAYHQCLGLERRRLKDLYTLTSQSLVHLVVTGGLSQRFSTLRFSVSVADRAAIPRVNVVYFSATLGYLQPPQNYDSGNVVIDCVTVTKPGGHDIFLTKSKLKLTGNLFLFAGECQQGRVVYRELEHFPVIFPTWLTDHGIATTTAANLDKMSILFRNYKYVSVSHELIFSLFRNVSAPYRVGSRWNCSKAVWPDLPRHFDCDLFVQCLEAEDEDGCPYTSRLYGAGFIESGQSQVFLTKAGNGSEGLEFHESYRAMERDCRSLGAVPVVFRTPRQWLVTMEALNSIADYVHVPVHLWIPLRPARLTLETSSDIYRKNMYIDTWQWGTGGAVAYYLSPFFRQMYPYASTSLSMHTRWIGEVNITAPLEEWPAYSDFFVNDNRLCEIPNPSPHRHTIVIINRDQNATASPLFLVTCPLQHVTLALLACDPRSVCVGRVEGRGLSYTALCSTSSLTQTSPYFSCRTGEQHVPYSVVCDWRQDCGDGSDEAFCRFPPCAEGSFDCGDKKCIHASRLCDRRDDCKTFTDERFCRKTDQYIINFNITMPPALVRFDRPGSFTVTPLPANTTQCPATHYQCPGDGYCLPVFTRCNDMVDCPGHEDEAGCEVHTCEGLYRCRGLDRTICLHGDHLCDGFAQCPLQDDELMCGMKETCPDQCVCYGMTMYRSETNLHLRYLEGRGTGLTSEVIADHTMLIHLGVGACGWRNVSDLRLVNLHVLDLSDNLLHVIPFKQLEQLLSLRELVLVGNPLTSASLRADGRYQLPKLQLLNLSRVPNQRSNLDMFSQVMPHVQVLDLSQSGLTSLQGNRLFRNVRTLDLQGCPVSEISPEFMKAMQDLKHVSGDNFKLCCSAVLPDDFTGKCVAPADEISSCENLLKSGVYALVLAVFALLALFGNLGSFGYRLTLLSAGKNKVGFLVFVLHLCLSDFLMGVYLSMLGVTDRLYAGSYLWQELAWKRSAVCHVAGFLSLLSCEVSSFLICLITLDRFLVIRFPFSRLRFGTTSAQVACGVIWGLGVILASVPLLPVTSHWEFYSQTGICIPLPVTRTDFPGRHYSFAVMIVVNFVLFLLIAVGQAFIYWSVKVNSLSQDASKSKDDVIAKDKARSKEVTIARRLLVIAMSDFLCWFPIGVCGLLAKLDIPVPGEVNAAMATLVLPVNAALNPFLYTYTVLRQKRQKEKEASLQRFLAAQVKQEVAASQR